MSRRQTRHIPQPDRNLLWSRSAGICCFPACSVICVREATSENPSATIGQIAHIESKSDRGPRANPLLSDRERDAYPNLILLCPTHHRLVDARESAFTADLLRTWKTERETTVFESLAQHMPSISFAELDIITKALVNNRPAPIDSLWLVPPQEKMDRNGLTNRTAILVNIGLIQSNQVQQFVAVMDGLDNTFIARLTSGFVDEYHQQLQNGLQGDSLFEAMRQFSAKGQSHIRFQCAGLAVLVYLFERCEVFER